MRAEIGDLTGGSWQSWEVRIGIRDDGTRTTARAVMLGAAPRLVADSCARRDPDCTLPPIGAEVAVARALRALADRLLDAAAGEAGEIELASLMCG